MFYLTHIIKIHHGHFKTFHSIFKMSQAIEDLHVFCYDSCQVGPLKFLLMASLKAFKPGLKLLSNHIIPSWSLTKETANKTTRNSIPSTKHFVQVHQHSSRTRDGYDCQVLVSIFSKTPRHCELKHLIVKCIQHKLHKTASLFIWHSICPWPSFPERMPIFIGQEFSSTKRAPHELEKCSISEKHSQQCPLSLVALASISLSNYLLMTLRTVSLKLWPTAVPDTTVQTLYTVNTLSADYRSKCLFVSIQDITKQKEISLLQHGYYDVTLRNLIGLYLETTKISYYLFLYPATHKLKWKPTSPPSFVKLSSQFGLQTCGHVDMCNIIEQ
jgi:hypothetical protein